MARILYVSYTGLMDPLGQSQVLQYLLGLSGDHNIALLTFEKPENLANTARLQDFSERCARAGIEWTRLTWHNRPNIPATMYDLVAGIRTARSIAKKHKSEIVHCRSYIASMIGLAVKRRTGARLIFDMRGFWPDERVDGGIWTKESFPYRFFKRVERSLFLNADHVVSLTRSGVREFSAFAYLQGKLPPVSVIPTCTNLKLFKPVDTPRAGFTLGYIGSAGSWYMFDDVARAVSRLFEMRPDARFLVLNKGGHEAIRRDLSAAGVDLARVELLESSFDKMADHISRMDAGIFFIKPAWSKRASCPTRMGEFLGCGKPCLANSGVGDVEEVFEQSGTGIVLAVDADGQLASADIGNEISRLIKLAGAEDVSRRCRETAEEHFSLEAGIREYSRIYSSLAHSAS